MDYEKKYNEALERARSMYESKDDAELASFIFPELRESEDERIRRTLVEYFGRYNPKDKWDDEFSFKDVLSYLEKQKEQKPVVTHGETYHVDALGTQQVIAGKMPQKPAWSEEDKEMVNSIINVVCGVGSQPNGLREKQVSFLKSLRPSWKPSGEQMEALYYASYGGELSPDEYFLLTSLYEHLQKL